MDAKTRIYGVQCSQVATRRASGPKQGAFPPRVTRLSEKWNPWQVRLAVAAERIPFDTRPLCSSRGIFFALGAAVGARDYCGRPRTGGRHYPPRPRLSKGDCVSRPPYANDPGEPDRAHRNCAASSSFSRSPSFSTTTVQMSRRTCQWPSLPLPDKRAILEFAGLGHSETMRKRPNVPRKRG